MVVTVAMYDKSYAHIGERLDALGLDIEVAMMQFPHIDAVGHYLPITSRNFI